MDADLPEASEAAFASLGDARELPRSMASRSRRSPSARARSARRSSSRRGVGRRPDRPGLRAALAAAVALLQPDRRLRAAEGALRGDGDRVPAGPPRGRVRGRGVSYAHTMKAVVIGCGRVGSSVAKALDRHGWDVVAIDEKRGRALAARRGLEGRVPRRPRHGRGAAARGGHRGRRRRRRRDERRQHEHRHRPGAREALRHRLRRRPHPRPGPRRALLHARPAHRLPDLERDLGADRRGAVVRDPARAAAAS